MRVAVTDGRLQVLARDNASLDIRRGPEAVLADALDTTRKLMAAEGIDRLTGVGIGVPGPVDFQKGSPSRRRSCRAGTGTRSATPSPASSALPCSSTTTST